MRRKPTQGMLAVFTESDACANAINALRANGHRVNSIETFSPYPNHNIAKASGHKVSPLGIATLIGALTGLVSGFALAAFTSLKVGLHVWGKPLFSWIPWVVVGFEFMILFGCLANFFTMLAMAGIPSFSIPAYYDPRFSTDHFGVFVKCVDADFGATKKLLIDSGAKEVHEHA